MAKIDIEYLKICPIDKKSASFEEILNYLECKDDYLFFQKKFYELIQSAKCDNLKNAKLYCEIENKLKAFIDFFKKISGVSPFALQIYWAKRFLAQESFSIIAPTGLGKTTFGIIFSLFLVKNLNRRKIYYIVPTKILLNEIHNKFIEYNKNLNAKILAILKTEDKEKIHEDFDILITTSQFLHKNFDILPKDFKLVFIDDADSMIRQPKNIDKVLMLIGFSKDDIEKTLEIISRKRKGEYEDAKKIKEDIILENKGQIIAASATLTPKTKRINLFRELLNFEIGLSSTYLRNIDDFYILDENFSEDLQVIFEYSKQLIQKFGKGGLVFLDDTFTKEDLKKYVDYLNNNKIKAISYEKFTQKNKKLFENGEIDVIVGFSNIRNPLTRGIDLPQVIRYGIFVGTPKFKVPLQINYSPRYLFMILLSLQKFLKDQKENFDLIKDMTFLRKYSFMKQEDVLANENIKKRIEIIQGYLRNLLENKELIEKIKNDPEISLIIENGNYFLLVPDPRGYIQASGRTSRLYPLGLTKGICVILAENKKLFENLKRKLNIIGYKIEFKNYLDAENKISELFTKVDQDREIVRQILIGKKIKLKDPVKTALIIVESPTKAKTIANFFGKPARRFYKNYIVYEVSIGNYIINITATMGHFVDLVYDQGIYGVKKSDEIFIPIFEPLKLCKNCKRHVGVFKNKCEICGSSDFFEKETLIEFLRKLASENQEIYLATDPDTEGEKIAFDLFCYLYPFNNNIKRIKLHEITKEEFLRQFKNPENLNFNLVQAQLTRRIADRWVGFYLSEEIQRYFKNLNLSAGRVQTPVLGWIINNYEKRKREKFYIIRAYLKNGMLFNFQTEDKEITKKIRKNSNKLLIELQTIDLSEKEIDPLPPFQTNELLKSAWDVLRFDVQTTMNLAQDLFERGLITYHRTDSYFVSKTGRDVAKEYLEKLQIKNLFHSRAWGTPGTHECIRPVKPLTVEEIIEQSLLNQQEILSRKHLRLYELIFNRFMASQMKPAKVESKLMKIKMILDGEEILNTEIEFINKIIESGFDVVTNSLRIVETYDGKYEVEKIEFIRIPKIPPFTPATLVEKMKIEGLGRPSTYSTIIQTLFERKYVIANKGYIIPTKHGITIFEHLTKKYPDLISENFTRDLEEKMDKIENSEIDYQEVLKELYDKIFK